MPRRVIAFCRTDPTVSAPRVAESGSFVVETTSPSHLRYGLTGALPATGPQPPKPVNKIPERLLAIKWTVVM